MWVRKEKFIIDIGNSDDLKRSNSKESAGSCWYRADAPISTYRSSFRQLMTSCHYCSLPAVTGKGWSTGEYRDGVFEPFMGPKSQVELTLIRLNSSDFKNSTSGYIADCLHLVPPKNTKFGKIFQLCLIKTFYFHKNLFLLNSIRVFCLLWASKFQKVMERSQIFYLNLKVNG